MTRRIVAADVTRQLTCAGHTYADGAATWRAGFRTAQASPRTVRIHHDGPDEAARLNEYADHLRASGYTVTTERPAGKRPRIRVTFTAPEEPRL